VDSDGSLALNDGILFLRYAFGFSGPSLTSGALGEGATRDAGEIVAFLSTCGTALDIDGNGAIEPLSDALILLRYLLGLRGGPLVTGAVGIGCTRCSSEQIETYLEELL
jgi:hypothetical protein